MTRLSGKKGKNKKMINDPYSVLSVSRDATKDEIKKAYRKMVKKYHPDLNPDNPDANKKMNEINEAYEMLMNPEKYRASGNSYSGNGSGAGTGSGYYGGYTTYDFSDFEEFFGFGNYGRITINLTVEPGDSPMLANAIRSVQARRFSEALNTLLYIPQSDRGARWYYVSSVANYSLGNTVKALEDIQTAARLDPSNSEYQRLLYAFSRSGRMYNQNSRTYRVDSVDPAKLCLGCLATQFFCCPCGCRCI